MAEGGEGIEREERDRHVVRKIRRRALDVTAFVEHEIVQSRDDLGRRRVAAHLRRRTELACELLDVVALERLLQRDTTPSSP